MDHLSFDECIPLSHVSILVVSHLLECCTICGMTSKPLGSLTAFLVALPKKAIACGEFSCKAVATLGFLGPRH